MDLADDIMGTISFPDLAFRMVAGRLPDERESVLFNAVLVSLADHGITPDRARRPPHLPRRARGTAGRGRRGPARGRQRVPRRGGGRGPVPARDPRPVLGRATTTTTALRAAAGDARRAPRRRGPAHARARAPGAQGDRSPRAADVRARRRARTCSARTSACCGSSPTSSAEPSGRQRLPINGAGVAGAALADLGFDWRIIRGFALLARTAGLLGHLAEEMRDVDGDAALAGGRGRQHAP